jgi:hypothetical protein
MSAVAITGRCVVLPRKSGTKLVMPPGFRTGNAYKVLSGFFPNGSTDLHLYVIGEGGLIAPLVATDVKMVDDNQQVFHFDEPVRVWEASTETYRAGWAETCLDQHGRKMLPHRVTWDATYRNVTIEWTRPVAGHFLLG